MSQMSALLINDNVYSSYTNSPYEQEKNKSSIKHVYLLTVHHSLPKLFSPLNIQLNKTQRFH